MTDQHWQSKPERTNAFWLRALLVALRLLGRGPVRWLVLPIVTSVYFLVDAKARRASREYLARVTGAPTGWSGVWRHMFVFATVSMDRILFLADRSDLFEVEIVNEDALTAVASGGVLVVAHFGSFDALRVVAQHRRGLAVHILLDKQHNQQVMALLQQLNPALADMIVDAGEAGPALAVRLQRLMQDGALVGIMGDRLMPGQRAVTVDFLDGQRPVSGRTLGAGCRVATAGGAVFWCL